MSTISFKTHHRLGLLPLALGLAFTLGCDSKKVVKNKESESEESSSQDEESEESSSDDKKKSKKDSTKKDKEDSSSATEEEPEKESGKEPEKESGKEPEETDNGSEPESDQTSKKDDSKSSSDTSSKTSEPEDSSGTKDKDKEPKKIKCEGDEPRVYFKTSLGAMSVKLDGVTAPTTVKNFIGYVNEGYYDDTIFHRVIPGFMIQGGGYDSQKKGKKDKAPIKLETSAKLKHLRGAISMARGMAENSATAQFFLCHAKAPHLDGKYAAFGYLIEGEKTLDAIAKVKTGPFKEGGATHENWPLTNVVIQKAYCF